MIAAAWLGGLLAHRGARLLSTAVGVAVGVALLASIGAFLSSTTATMTQRAAVRVPVDGGVEGRGGVGPAPLPPLAALPPGLMRALPVAFAATTGLRAT